MTGGGTIKKGGENTLSTNIPSIVNISSMDELLDNSILKTQLLYDNTLQDYKDSKIPKNIESSQSIMELYKYIISKNKDIDKNIDKNKIPPNIFKANSFNEINNLILYRMKNVQESIFDLNIESDYRNNPTVIGTALIIAIVLFCVLIIFPLIGGIALGIMH